MKQKRAFLYIRVSTDEQADKKGYSLKHQEERLRSYCQFQNIEVVDLYKDDHSAKTFERPAFKQLLAFLKKNKKADEKFVMIQSLEKIKSFFNELKASLG